MKKFRKRNIIIISTIVAILITAISITIYAAISKTATRGEIEVSTAKVNATTTYTATDNSFDWTYNEAGETKEIQVKTSNSSGVVLHRFYNIEAANTSDTNLLKAILVYYNDEFIGTLNNIANANIDIQNEFDFIPLGGTRTDSFKFELHQAAVNSMFDKKSINVTIKTFTENADYFNYIYVHNEEEFAKAVDDLNSGLFEENPVVVLCNTITLENSYTLKNPTTIYLNGCTLNGPLTLNDDNENNPDAVIEILGDGTFNANVTLGANYDLDKAKELVLENVKNTLKDKVLPGSTTNIIGNYGFYNRTIETWYGCTYLNGNVTVDNSSNVYYTKLAAVKVDNVEVPFKINGSKVALLDSTLAHLPALDSTITTDLFLPTYIPSENATITWKSSDEAIITADGKITADRLENAAVKLYAEIKVNDTVITRTYSFKVSVHNNEINFYKLVQEISPIVIANVYNDADDADDALYYLPIISQNSDGTFNTYDYRKSYVTPVNTQLFNWQAFKDIGLEAITYSMTSEQRAAYDYITLAGNNLYLNTETLNSFARINITGDFGNDETYTTFINISISVGSNTQLLEKAFQQVSSELSEISVLGNIISTRISSGMANENGDFSLSAVYAEDPDYTIEFSGADTIINSITYNETTNMYDFTINPEYFNEYETTVAFDARVYYKKGTAAETSKSRTFYVTVPAALHISDFGTISLYESIKYQTFNQLPDAEKAKASGYSKSGSILSDSNINYVLLRDIVGDANYISEYDSNEGYYLTKCRYEQASQYASGVSRLNLSIRSTNDTQTTDTAAYDLAKIIEWATSNVRITASTVVSNSSALGSLSGTKSNGEDYLNNEELNVVKQVYKYYTGASDAVWNTIYSEAFSEAPGYIYTNPELLNQVIVTVSNTRGTFYNGGSATNFATIFGKYMEVIQRYAVSTTSVNKNDAAPCQEIYNTRYRWVESDTNLTSYTYQGTKYDIDWSVQLNNGKWWCRYKFAGGSSGGDGGGDPINYSTYASDRTSYITENELTILRVFWLNAVSASNSTTGLAASTTANYANIQKVLQDDAGLYYSGFVLADFNAVGKALLNAFDACLEIPTYFTADGVSILMKHFYNEFNYNSQKYDLNEYGKNTTTFKTSLNNDIPYVTNIDSLKSSLSYFKKLAALEIYGCDGLAAFLSENGLSTLVARTSLVNTNISRLVMQNVAHINTNFDLTNIKNYNELTYLDLSNNLGINSVNELVNANRGNYTYVNITNIGVEPEYQEFAIDNIATSKCTIYYTNSSKVNTYSNDSSRASDLADLSDFNKFISKYMYMTNVIYNEDGSTTAINWRIDEGNEIYGTIDQSGRYPTIATVEDMNKFISPYYYCNESFTYTYGNGQSLGFIAGYAYEASFQGGLLQFVSMGKYDKTNVIDDSLRVTNNASSITDTITTKITSTETSVDEGTTSIVSTTICYENADSITKNVTVTFNGYKLTSTNNTTNNNHISYSSNNNYFVTNSSNANATVFFFLTADEVSGIINKDIGYDGQTLGNTTGNDLYMCFVYNNTLYFVGDNSHGTGTSAYAVNATTNLDNACKYNVSYNSNRYTITDNTGVRTMYLISYNNVLYHYYTQAATYRFYRFSNSTDIDYTSTFRPYFYVYDTDGSDVVGYYAYSLYCRLVKLENKVTSIEQVESVVNASVETGEKYYLYTGPTITYDGVTIKQNTIIQIKDNYVTPVSSRSKTDVKTENQYFVMLYFKTSADSEEYTLDVTNYGFVEWISTYDGDYEELDITSIEKPSNTSTTVEGTWSNWTNPVEWQFNKVFAYNYASYVTEIDSSRTCKVSLDEKVKIYSGVNENQNIIYRYTGTNGSENVYKRSTTATATSYTTNNGYKLSISNKVLAWTSYGTVNDTTGTTMDSILAEANQHFKDYQYGSYFGRYYAYSGTDRYISSGIYVKQYYIYRIMPNALNTAFEWVEIQPYTNGDMDDYLISLGTGKIGVGTIFYANDGAAFGFFDIGWYKVTLDEKTNIVNLVKYNDMGITINGASTYTMLTNDKLVPKTIGDGQDYLGYSGTFTLQVTALIRTVQNDGTVLEYKKIYKIKFVGSLY